jgi:hypothetical protein
MMPMDVSTVVSVAPVAGTVITAIIVAPAGANADPDADRTSADPHALRACWY